MKTYRETCLIGSIDYDPRRRLGALNTSVKWKSWLDKTWEFFSLELVYPTPVDADERERYWWMYKNIREIAFAIAIGTGAMVAYTAAITVFAF